VGNKLTANTLDKQDKKFFYAQLLSITIPVMLQQLVAVGLNLVDTIMVGKLSENALAAVGAANQIYFIYSVAIFGVFSGAAVYAVQYWGIKDVVNFRKVMGIDYIMCFALTVPAIAAARLFGPQLVSLFTDDAEVIDLAVQYLDIACISYIFSGLSFVITYNSRSVAILKVPTAISMSAVLMNVFLNFCLIYGKLGFPELGVRGAAIATLTARICECAAMMSYIYIFSKEHPLKAKISEMIHIEKAMFVKVMKTASPVIANEGLWAISTAIVFAIYGQISAAALAIVQIANTVTEVFQTLYAGMSNASSVIIGRTLGRGDKDMAYKYAMKMMKLIVIFNIFTMLLLIAAIWPIAGIYGFGPETTDMLIKSLLVFAAAQLPKMLVYVLICGIIRAGGDTVWCLIVEFIFNFCAQVSLAFLAVNILGLPLYLAIAVVMTSEIVKSVVCIRRVLSKKWMNVFTGR
jgi:putative MATE family efflux protein